MLEEIKIRIQQKLNQKHKDLILAYYQIMINNHNEFCGCNYCLILEKYVKLKKYLCVENRRLDNEYYTSSLASYNWRNANLYELERDIINTKIEKDKLKLL